MNISKETNIGQLVAQDYRSATAFKSFGIDFCCNGNRTIGDACVRDGIDSSKLIDKLNRTLIEDQGKVADYQSWDLDLLADYIEKKHHRYVVNKIPELTTYLKKIVSVHGSKHPELKEIESLFQAGAHELLNHMKKEENILFPHIRKQAEAEAQHTSPVRPHFGTVNNPIQMMMHEHDVEGERFRKIAELSDNYTPPVGACTTYQVTFSMLKEFEADLHLHIHLENNILFPKSLELEKQLAYA